MDRGQQQKHYSIIATTLCYRSHYCLNTSTLRRGVIASYSYRSRLVEIVTASYSYCSGLIIMVIIAYIYRTKVIKTSSLLIIMLLIDLTLVTTAMHAYGRKIGGGDNRVR
jgi:hypothetical protein